MDIRKLITTGSIERQEAPHLEALYRSFADTAESEFCYRGFAEDSEEAIVSTFRTMPAEKRHSAAEIAREGRELCLELGDNYDLTRKPDRW